MTNTGYVENLPTKELNDLLNTISELSPFDLLQAMSAISNGLIRYRDEALERSLDMETAVANLVKRKMIDKGTYKFVRDEFIRPHESYLRWPGLIETFNKRVGEE